MACVAFQTQLSSIMEVLVKAAVAEISKLVDDNSAFLHLEISRKQSENEMLKRKLLAAESNNAQMQRVFESLMDRGCDGGSGTHTTGLIKEESPDEVLWISDPAGSGHFDGDSFASDEHGLHMSVKTERETASGSFGRDGCQLGAVKQNRLADLSLDDRDHQVWSSIIEGDDIDSAFPDFSSVVAEYSDAFAETRRSSGPSQPSSNGANDREYPKEPPATAFPSGPQSDLRKEQIYPQAGEASDVPAALGQPDAAQRPSLRGLACAQCGKTFWRLQQLKLHQQSHKRKRVFWCTVCGKGFQCSSHLSIHYRTHTGEKPYGCLQCGKRFTQQSSLRVHQRTHSGERPYNCAECGKTFILMHHLKRHCVIHTYR
ncbi:zinc finger protein 554-like isoform X1 [Syngnathus typhle]|uniref:zinc finger protein 554-like isoform X1 n=2 Tax=Syngnathus typhle TaxID=161592 RepID=UPI002A6A2F7E|nr:zinc finger protein 554-like isoform X1 [Syngnathus typhle]